MHNKTRGFGGFSNYSQLVTCCQIQMASNANKASDFLVISLHSHQALATLTQLSSYWSLSHYLSLSLSHSESLHSSCSWPSALGLNESHSVLQCSVLNCLLLGPFHCFTALARILIWRREDGLTLCPTQCLVVSTWTGALVLDDKGWGSIMCVRCCSVLLGSWLYISTRC